MRGPFPQYVDSEFADIFEHITDVFMALDAKCRYTSVIRKAAAFKKWPVL
jgi:hypothetical protein